MSIVRIWSNWNPRRWLLCERSAPQSCVAFCNPRTVAHQAPLSMELSRQEHWRGLTFTSPGNLPNPGIKPALEAESFTG